MTTRGCASCCAARSSDCFSQIYTAKDGSEGLQLARSQRADVILSDYDMPNMDGLEFLKAVREDQTFAKTAFVMFSGVANSAITKRAEELGANSIIMKPFFRMISSNGLKLSSTTLSVQRLNGSRRSELDSGIAELAPLL